MTEGELAEVDSYFSRVANPIQRTRKGRVWSIWVSDRPVEVAIQQTEKVLSDCEDELLELGLLPEDAPERVVLCAGCNSDEDYELLRRIGNDLARLLDGLPTEPEK